MSKRPILLFIDRDNGYHAALAVALARNILGETIEIRSASLFPALSVHETIIRLLEAHGLDTAHLRPRMLLPGEVEEARWIILINTEPQNLVTLLRRPPMDVWNLDNPDVNDMKSWQRILEETARLIEQLMKALDEDAVP